MIIYPCSTFSSGSSRRFLAPLLLAFIALMSACNGSSNAGTVSSSSATRVVVGSNPSATVSRPSATPLVEATPVGTPTQTHVLSGTFREIPLPTPNAGAAAITADSDGNLWMVEVIGNVQSGSAHTKLVRMTPSGAFHEFPLSLTLSSTNYISSFIAGPDGNFWCIHVNAEIQKGTLVGVTNSIVRISRTGQLTEFSLPSTLTRVLDESMAVGPDGNLWFTTYSYSNATPTTTNTGAIGRITPAGKVGIVSVLPNTLPAAITAGPDGNMWFTSLTGTSMSTFSIGRITAAGTVTEFPLPTNADARYITTGHDGNLWFTEDAAGKGGSPKIGRITTAGRITEFPLSSPNGILNDITMGSDGAVWFTDSANDVIGRISPRGAVNEFPVPAAGGHPTSITAGPGGMWFTQEQGGIGHLVITLQ